MPSLSSFLPTVNPGKFFFDNERGDALVSRRGIDRGEENEESGFFAVGDPELAAIENVVAAFEFGFGLQSESVGAGTGFAQGVGSAGIGGHARQIALLLFFGAPAQQGVVDQRVLHVHDDAGGGIHARHFFDCENRLEEFPAAAAVLLGNLDAHQSKLKELVNQVFIEDAFFVHFFHQRADFFFGKLADVVAEKNFVFGEAGQRASELAFAAWSGI